MHRPTLTSRSRGGPWLREDPLEVGPDEQRAVALAPALTHDEVGGTVPDDAPLNPQVGEAFELLADGPGEGDDGSPPA